MCCSLAMVAPASLSCFMSNFRSGWSDFVAPSEDCRWLNDGFRAGAGGRIIVESLFEGESDRELLEKKVKDMQ